LAELVLGLLNILVLRLGVFEFSEQIIYFGVFLGDAFVVVLLLHFQVSLYALDVLGQLGLHLALHFSGLIEVFGAFRIGDR